MPGDLGRFVLSDPVVVLTSPYVDWWDESQESGVVPDAIQGSAKRSREVSRKFNPEPAGPDEDRTGEQPVRSDRDPVDL